MSSTVRISDDTFSIVQAQALQDEAFSSFDKILNRILTEYVELKREKQLDNKN